MRSGAIDGVLVTNVKTVDQWTTIPGSSVKQLPAMGVSMLSMLSMLSMDVTTAPLNDIHVRRAIAHSIDHPGVMAAAYGKASTSADAIVSVETMVPVAPSWEAVDQFLDSLPRYDFDLAKARAELAKSAYPEGFSLDVPYIAGTPASELVVLNLQENLKQIGVTLTPKAVDTDHPERTRD